METLEMKRFEIALIWLCTLFFAYQFGKSARPNISFEKTTQQSQESTTDLTQNKKANFKGVSGLKISTPDGAQISADFANEIDIVEMLRKVQAAKYVATESAKLSVNLKPMNRLMVGHTFSAQIPTFWPQEKAKTGLFIQYGHRIGQTPQWVDVGLLPSIQGGFVSYGIEF